ncbi:MAG: hypothetical protein D6775_12975 [Caldilineae bacterium]|nr:MAG: hypothetical protein D6775_12975 [Caldilineae bacterium]
MLPNKKTLERVSPTAVVESNLERVLGEDLVLVREKLMACIHSGFPFVDEMLVENLHQHYPRAIIVLGTTRLGHTTVEKRVALAAAIEMLHLATYIHSLIPRGEIVVDENTRTLLGASILIGDYCFSQASALAAQTNNPAVVAAFADALAQLAEGRVLTLLENPERPYSDDAVLFAAAAEAGALLVGLPRPMRYALREAAAAFGEVLTDSETSLAEAIAQLEALLRDRPLARPLVNWLRSRLPV